MLKAMYQLHGSPEMREKNFDTREELMFWFEEMKDNLWFLDVENA